MIVDDNSFVTFGITGMKLDYERKIDCMTKGSVKYIIYETNVFHKLVGLR